MSIRDWINAYVPGRHSSKLGQLLDVAYNIEYGAECERAELAEHALPARLRGPGPAAHLRQVEREVPRRGGNDQITDRLAAALAGQITMGPELTAIKRNGDGTYDALVPSGLNDEDDYGRSGGAGAAVLDAPLVSTARRRASSRSR